MRILNELTGDAHRKNLPFLVIEGHAVNAYGVGRNTLDLDLLIPRDQKEKWKSFFLEKGYTIFHEHSNFLQLSPPDSKHWPIDLMLVDQLVFEEMLRESITSLVQDTRDFAGNEGFARHPRAGTHRKTGHGKRNGKNLLSSLSSHGAL